MEITPRWRPFRSRPPCQGKAIASGGGTRAAVRIGGRGAVAAGGDRLAPSPCLCGLRYAPRPECPGASAFPKDTRNPDRRVVSKPCMLVASFSTTSQRTFLPGQIAGHCPFHARMRACLHSNTTNANTVHFYFVSEYLISFASDDDGGHAQVAPPGATQGQGTIRKPGCIFLPNGPIADLREPLRFRETPVPAATHPSAPRGASTLDNQPRAVLSEFLEPRGDVRLAISCRSSTLPSGRRDSAVGAWAECRMRRRRVSRAGWRRVRRFLPAAAGPAAEDRDAALPVAASGVARPASPL